MMDSESPLDAGINRIEIDDNTNPFYIQVSSENYKVNYDSYGKLQLPSNIKRVLVMYPKKIDQIPNEIYEKNINRTTLQSVCEYFSVIPCSYKISEVPTHADVALYLPRNIIMMLHPDFEIEDDELVVPIFELDSNSIHEYVSMFGTIAHDFAQLERQINYKKNFNVSKIPIKMNDIVPIIYDYFWYYPSGEFNLSQIFENRRIALTRAQREHIIPEDVLSEINPQQRNPNYASISETRYRTTIADAIKKAKDHKFYMKHSGTPTTCVTTKQVENMFSSINDSRSLYNLFNAFVTSRNFCHLVTHNSNILDMMRPLFVKYDENFRYVLGYAFLTYYIEESMLRQNITRQSRCVFDIHTASQLPHFKICDRNPHASPYNVLPISDVLSSRSFIGLKFLQNYSYGIDTLENFRKKFNIFTTGSITKNTFDGIDWSRIAISGSAMPACIPKSSPLIFNANSHKDDVPYEDSYRNFFKMYYESSDIDIVCATTDMDVFIDDTFNLMTKVASNLDTTLISGDLVVTPISMARVFVHKQILNRFLPDLMALTTRVKNVGDIEHIIKNFGSGLDIANARLVSENYVKVLEYFYGLYASCKESKYNGVQSRNTIHEMYMKNSPIEHFSVQLLTKPRKIYHKAVEIMYSETMTFENPKSKYKDTGFVFSIEDTFRFKMTNAEGHNLLHRSFEIFRATGDDPFSTIHHFHLPCVRAFYDGNNVYMTASCLYAYMTNMNMDFKYFAGSVEPVNIIIKYLKRGFGTYLNDFELNSLRQSIYTTYHIQLTKQLDLSSPVLRGDVANKAYAYYDSPNVTKTFINKQGDVEPFDSTYCEMIWNKCSKK